MGGSAFTFDTEKATAKLTRAPTAPIDSGEIPSSQHSAVSGRLLVPGMNSQPLYTKMYTRVKVRPDSMPRVAPTLFTRLEKIPIIRAGNSEAAAIPNASATTWAAKAGGLA